MVPESVNLSDLSEQLLVDGVALERDNDALHQDLVAAKDYAASRGVGELGIAGLEAPPGWRICATLPRSWRGTQGLPPWWSRCQGRPRW